MKDSIEETKKMLESYWQDQPYNKPFFYSKSNMTSIVMSQLALPEDEAYKFVCNWFDNRH